MKLLKPSPSLGKNAFDMSYRSVFAAKFGELLPVYCQEIVPNDTIELRVADLLRAKPMVTSPFMRAKQHLDVWFVPYNKMWSRFNEFLVGREEPSSSAAEGCKFIPHATMKDWFTAVFSADNASVKDVVGQDYRKGAKKLLDLLGYPTFGQNAGEQSLPQQFDDYDVNLMRLAAYNDIWYHEYRQQYYDSGSLLVPHAGSAATATEIAKIFNFDYLNCDDEQGADVGYNAPNVLVAMSQMRYRLWKKDLFTGLLPDTQFGVVSAVEIDGDITGTFSVTGSGNVGVPIGAQPINSLNNLSWQDINGDPVVPTFSSQVANGLVPSSTASGSGISDGNIAMYGANEGTLFLKQAGIAPGGTTNVSASDIAAALSVTASGSGSVSGFDILALRKATAVQIWRERALRAGNQVQDNFRAHYGSEPRTHMNSHPTFVGSVDAPLNIGDITATANTGVGSLGALADVAGKGMSSLDEKVFKFTNSGNDFGVLMGIWSMLPETEYNATGIDPMNCLLESDDFFKPEYENLGLAPVGSEVITTSVSLQEGDSPSVILGYAPRYWQYKTRLDLVHNSFMVLNAHIGADSSWVSPKYDVDVAVGAAVEAGTGVMPLSCLYVNPSLFDGNFVVNAADEDQFIVDMYFDATAIRSMSVSGMPSA